VEYLKEATSNVRTSSATSRQRAQDMRYGTKKHIRAKESEVGNKFVSRISAIGTEVSNERKCVNALSTERTLLKDAIANFAETVSGQLTWPLEVNLLCVKLRDGRQGIDRVCDQAECELATEKEMLLELEKTLAAQGTLAKNQLQQLEANLMQVNADLKRKRAAEQVDDSMARLGLEDKEKLHWEPKDIQARPKSAVETKTWTKHNKTLIANAFTMCEFSKSIRQDLENATAGAGAAIKKQELATTEALRARLSELVEARKVDSRLTTQLDYEIDSAKRERRSLRRAIEEQQNTLKRTSTRLGTRTRRPGVEKTRDTARCLGFGCKQVAEGSTFGLGFTPWCWLKVQHPECDLLLDSGNIIECLSGSPSFTVATTNPVPNTEGTRGIGRVGGRDRSGGDFPFSRV
jgi:hypothetical protein